MPISREFVHSALIIFGLWTAHGLFISFESYFRLSGTKSSLLPHQALILELGFSYLWALVTPLILWAGNRFPLVGRRWWKSLPPHLVCAFVMTALTYTVWNYTLMPLVWPARVPKSFESLARAWVSTLEIGVMQYCLVVLGQYAYRFYRRYEEGVVRASQLEAQLARAQFMALRMQLNPHFLFNTLNTISELIHASPKRAERMLIQLSDFLRTTLQSTGNQEIALEQELDFLDQYLEIERIRFGDRISVEMALDADALEAQVPNFLLQPIVENALHHGLRDKTSNGKLRIEAVRSNGHLQMSVFDNGPGVVAENGSRTAKPVVTEGLGLGNTRERLSKLYGKDHEFSVENLEQGGFQVTISIPYRLKENR